MQSLFYRFAVMIFFFSGTDREKVRVALAAAVEKKAKGSDVLRITDAHSIADLTMALQGPGMFGGERVLVLDGVLSSGNEESRTAVVAALSSLKKGKELIFIAETSLDAAARKQVEKYAETSERFEVAKKQEEKTIFALANALEKGDKKSLWIGYQRELIKGTAPEAIHGLLFWGAKRSLQFARNDTAREKARRVVIELVELPHVARRRGEAMEYALERFVLSIA